MSEYTIEHILEVLREGEASCIREESYCDDPGPGIEKITDIFDIIYAIILENDYL